MATISSVAANELIASAWGNSIATELNTNVVKKTGTQSMAGPLTVTGAVAFDSTVAITGTLTSASTAVFDAVSVTDAPASASFLTRKDYVDTAIANSAALKLNLTGGTLSGTLAAATITSSASIAAAVNVTADANMQADGNITAGAPSIGGSTNGVLLTGSTGGITSVNNDAGASVPSANLSRQGAGAAAVGQVYCRFSRTSADDNIGSITIASSSSVAYNTTSDRRLKQKTNAADSATAMMQMIGRKAYRGRWKDDDKNAPEWFFLDAQDIQEHMPELVLENDAKMLQVNFPGMIPALTAALANALDRIDTLEARLAALENR